MTTNTMTTTTGAPYALGIGKSTALVACATLAEASRAYRAVCEAHERTGRRCSGFPEGRVYDTTGATPTLVARVSWNGKVWSPKTWAPGDEPLYSPYAADAVGGAR